MNRSLVSFFSACICVIGVVGCGSSVSAADLSIGDCFETPEEGQFTKVEKLDCEENHTAELYAEFASEEDDYSKISGSDLGVDQSTGLILSELELRCNELLVEVVENGADLPDDFDIFLIYPTEEEWEDGERNVQCVVTSETGFSE